MAQHSAFQMRDDPIAVIKLTRAHNYDAMIYVRPLFEPSKLPKRVDPLREFRLTTTRLAFDVVAHLYN